MPRIGSQYFTADTFEFDQNGVPLAGGQLFFYVSGTTTPALTYTGPSLSTPSPVNANGAIQADANGRFGAIWLQPDVAYKVQLFTASTPDNPSGTQIWSEDPIGPAAGGAVSAVVTNIAALRALASGASSVLVQGYYTAGDGGGGIYYLGSSGIDNGGSIIVSGDGTYYLETFGAPYSVRQFGAMGNSTGTGTGNDDTTAFQNALTAAGPGGRVFAPPCNVLGGVYQAYRITATLPMNYNGLSLTGAGAGDNHDFGGQINAPCRLLWDGATGGTMIQVKSTTSQAIAGLTWGGIFLDGNSGKAGIGLQALSTRLCNFQDIVGTHFTFALFVADIDTGLADPAGFTTNVIGKVAGYQQQAGDGSIVVLNGNASWDCSQNIYGIIEGVFLTGPALAVNSADSETFMVVKLFRTTGGTDTGIRLSAGATSGQTARNNMFWYVGVDGGDAGVIPMFAAGTDDGTVASTENNVVFLDTANNATLPSIDTGATLWWGTIAAPLSKRSFSIGTNAIAEQDASGLITWSGVSGTIAPGATGTVTLPGTFAVGCESALITPRSSPSVASAAPTLSTLVITNAGSVSGGASTDFYWQVKGT